MASCAQCEQDLVVHTLSPGTPQAEADCFLGLYLCTPCDHLLPLSSVLWLEYALPIQPLVWHLEHLRGRENQSTL